MTASNNAAGHQTLKSITKENATMKTTKTPAPSAVKTVTTSTPVPSAVVTREEKDESTKVQRPEWASMSLNEIANADESKLVVWAAEARNLDEVQSGGSDLKRFSQEWPGFIDYATERFGAESKLVRHLTTNVERFIPRSRMMGRNYAAFTRKVELSRTFGTKK